MFGKYKINPVLHIVYGAPGVGKTTVAAHMARKALAANVPVWSNVPINGCRKISVSDIGNFDVSNGLLLIDEAGIEYNNRAFKTNFTPDSLRWFKLHRHYHVEIWIFSQGFDDMDKKLRTLARYLYVVRRSLIPYFVYLKCIAKKPDIDPITHSPVDFYFFRPLWRDYIYCPVAWKLFDTHEAPALPSREWEIY